MSNLYFVNICIVSRDLEMRGKYHRVKVACFSENLSVSIQRQLTVIVGHDATEIILHQMN